VGYTFSVRPRDFGVAILAFALFTPIAAGFGLLTGFLHPAHHLPGLIPSAGKILGIFLATGVPEELLFRGLLQNLVLRWTSRPGVSVAIASLVFGAAHLNSGPSPDLRYFLLATLAGAVYGLVYRRTGTLMAPAMTHTLVNSAWTLFLRG
jgi:membrane protease YdiL (CAAX protease family)